MIITDLLKEYKNLITKMLTSECLFVSTVTEKCANGSSHISSLNGLYFTVCYHI